MLTQVAADQGARELDVPDLVEFLAGTGMRIGEALGVRAEVIDLDAGRVIPYNANRDVKEVLGRIDAQRFGWGSSRTFRKTVRPGSTTASAHGRSPSTATGER